MAPKASAVCTATNPIGPAPVTSTRDPGPTRPFVQAHTPTESGSSNAASSSLIESGTGCAKAWCTTTCSANAPSIGGVAKNRICGHRL